MTAPFIYQHRVSYAECTVGNHVYHSRYLDLLERARGEYFRALGHPLLPWQERGFAFPVIEIHLRYERLARYDDLLEVAVSPKCLRGARLTIGHRVHCAGALVLEGETVHVCTDLREKPRRFPPELVTALKPELTGE